MEDDREKEQGGEESEIEEIVLSIPYENQNVVEKFQRKLKIKSEIVRGSWGSSSCSILRVPQSLREGKEKHYQPRTISIGPFHRGSLEDMEARKWKYLRAIINRTNHTMEDYLIVIDGVEKDARKHYSEPINLDNNSFVEMLVVDGFFLIELFCREAGSVQCDEEDPIFKVPWLYETVKRDILKLENQIPFFVLQKLFDKINSGFFIGDTLTSLALKFLSNAGPSTGTIDTKYLHGEAKHLLHLYHLCLTSRIKITKGNQGIVASALLPSVTQLSLSGIKFKRGNPKNFLDIKFYNGVLEIPPIFIGDLTNSLLLNLIAFEQLFYFNGCAPVTAYAAFMNCLIHSANDVEILCQEQIIDYFLGNEEEVADLISGLCKEIYISNDFYLSRVFTDINDYCESWLPKQRSRFIRHFFKRRFSSIAIVAAIIFLLLSCLQTFFLIYGYLHPRPLFLDGGF